jgi:hypothetical protein
MWLQVLEDMPQELRSRFWFVLLQRPDLAAMLMVSRSDESAALSVSNRSVMTTLSPLCWPLLGGA